MVMRGILGGIAGPVLGGWAATYNLARVLIVPIIAAGGVAVLAWIVASRKRNVATITSD